MPGVFLWLVEGAGLRDIYLQNKAEHARCNQSPRQLKFYGQFFLQVLQLVITPRLLRISFLFQALDGLSEVVDLYPLYNYFTLPRGSSLTGQ